jgi:hypothetical protein
MAAVRAAQSEVVASSARNGPPILRNVLVTMVIRRACRRAGVGPTAAPGHSLRCGFSTAAGLAQAPERAIMRQTAHRSKRTLRKTARPASVFVENACA